MDFLNLIWLIPLFPAAGFVINGLFGKRMSKDDRRLYRLRRSFRLLCFRGRRRLSTPAARSRAPFACVKLYEWINAGPAHTSEGPLARFQVDWGFLLDPLSSIMVLVVTGIGFLIHIYSTGYMHEEDGFYRFFAYLNLFMFSMLTLILGSNYLMMLSAGKVWDSVRTC